MKKIAILIPCYNEEITVAKVITDFKKELPDALIYVYNNNSTDNTLQIAYENGAIVKNEYRQGKGNGTAEYERSRRPTRSLSYNTSSRIHKYRWKVL